MTAGSAMAAVQAAVYSKLTADVGAGGLLNVTSPMITGVFDEVPDGQSFPYIVIGDQNEASFSTMAKDGGVLLITLHIWSQAKGFREAELVLGRANYLLDGALVITGYAHVGTVYEGADTLRDPDGITRHIAARYRVYAQSSA